MSAARTLLVVIMLALLAAGIAMAVAGGKSPHSVTALGDVGTNGGQLPSIADTSSATGASLAGIGEDPAKQEPVLDKFVGHDPFVPLVSSSAPTSTPTPTATPTATPTPTPTSTAENPTSAVVTVSGTKYTVAKGSKLPPSSPVFTISELTTAGVTFKLLNNMRFEDGSTSVQVAEGQTVSVTNADTGRTYKLTVNQLNFGTQGGTSFVPAQGHIIKLLSINTRNGVSSATFKVDGTTFADKQVGDVFSTGWGQIKVLAIDAVAQKVTFMHGDATFTLHVGEWIIK